MVWMGHSGGVGRFVGQITRKMVSSSIGKSQTGRQVCGTNKVLLHLADQLFLARTHPMQMDTFPS